MGIPVTDPIERTSRDGSSLMCPVLRQGRNPFRRTMPFLPFLEEPERTSVWTRNIRQRGEVLHTEAPEVNEEQRQDETPALDVEEPACELLPPKRSSEKPKRHRYKLRLGYDPRIFLEDPLLRGQQLNEEAEKWAKSYRKRIPMVTDPQMARRLSTEQSRYVQTDSGDMLRVRAGAQGSQEGSPTGQRAHMHYSSVSDMEDDEEYDVASDENEGRAAQQQQPLAHISNILLNGVSPDDYTSRVQDSLAVLGQALRAGGARTVGVQAAGNGSRVRVPISPALLDRVNDLNQDLGRILGSENTRAGQHHRRITRITGYLQRQAGAGPTNSEPDADVA